jgi:hypothetical protein
MKVHFCCILVHELEKEERKLSENNKERKIYQFNHSSAMKIDVININEFHLNRGVKRGGFCL